MNINKKYKKITKRIRVYFKRIKRKIKIIIVEETIPILFHIYVVKRIKKIWKLLF